MNKKHITSTSPKNTAELSASTANVDEDRITHLISNVAEVVFVQGEDARTVFKNGVKETSRLADAPRNDKKD